MYLDCETTMMNKTHQSLAEGNELIASLTIPVVVWLLMVYTRVLHFTDDSRRHRVESDGTYSNISSIEDTIITVQQLSQFESDHNEPMQQQCHLWRYNGSHKQRVAITVPISDFLSPVQGCQQLFGIAILVFVFSIVIGIKYQIAMCEHPKQPNNDKNKLPCGCGKYEAENVFHDDTTVRLVDLRFCCEVLTLLAVLVRTSKDIVDMQQIGMKHWWIAIVPHFTANCSNSHCLLYSSCDVALRQCHDNCRRANDNNAFSFLLPDSRKPLSEELYGFQKIRNVVAIIDFQPDSLFQTRPGHIDLSIFPWSSIVDILLPEPYGKIRST
ncbi:hypothetical protein DICVIV_04182 [Dictyocaulus viviparus]|uniref:Uncharacterized protein n=1 Tax=Dictyocaulus viviparus TaxID=29172 RepID=A0A0D8XZ21_DICVI|nr:hypothetical protein DICVIV_04182 [Dictyocaulus viviparus]